MFLFLCEFSVVVFFVFLTFWVWFSEMGVSDFGQTKILRSCVRLMGKAKR